MPDRSSAFELEDELKPLRPLAIGSHGIWHVEVDDEGDHLAEIVAVARDWLREHDLDELVVCIDGAELHVRR